MTPRFQLASADQLPTIVALYNEAVQRGGLTASTEPVTVEAWRPWLEDHQGGGYPVYVMTVADQLAGWLSYSAHRPGREALRYTAEISYYLAEKWQGRGLGSQLLAWSVEEGRRLGFKTLFAILLETNTGSIRLLEKHGFARWGYLPDVAEIGGRECGQFYYGRRIQA